MSLCESDTDWNLPIDGRWSRDGSAHARSHCVFSTIDHIWKERAVGAIATHRFAVQGAASRRTAREDPSTSRSASTSSAARVPSRYLDISPSAPVVEHGPFDRFTYWSRPRALCRWRWLLLPSLSQVVRGVAGSSAAVMSRGTLRRGAPRSRSGVDAQARPEHTARSRRTPGLGGSIRPGCGGPHTTAAAS